MLVPVRSVTDPADPDIADYRNVPDPELLERRGVFVAEGRLVVRRLLTGARFRTRSVMVTRPALAAIEDCIPAAGPIPVYVVPQTLMDGVTGFNMHRGCLAIGERRPADDWRIVAATARRLVMLERIANADNVGAVFRNAAAFAFDGVLLDPASADPLYRKAIRTSMGAALSVPFARVSAWPDAIEALRGSGVTVLGLTPDRRARPLREVTAGLGERRVAILAGHEGEGLTAGALERCDHRVRIPTADTVDSLNVATAAAIAMYELY